MPKEQKTDRMRQKSSVTSYRATINTSGLVLIHYFQKEVLIPAFMMRSKSISSWTEVHDIYIKCQFKHLNSGRRDFFAFSILFVSSFHVSWKRETCWSLPQLPGDVIYMSRELMKFEQQSKNVGQEALIELQSWIWCTLNHVSLVRTETKGK